MDVGDEDDAVALLQRVSYYRLSGYWYPFRQFSDDGRSSTFRPGTRLSDVKALYDFDVQLRAATFAELSRIETFVRSRLGHELGRIDPCVHLMPDKLGTEASKHYAKWLRGYEKELDKSRADFVVHHKENYDGRLPVWVAVELLDWGSLAWLFSISPRTVQDSVAGDCGLRAPQLGDWLRKLNLVRNTCAHQGRLFNRVHGRPKLPGLGVHPDLDAATSQWQRTFAQLTLVQFLLDRFGLGRRTMLPAVLRRFPEVQFVTMANLGAPPMWDRDSRLWGP